MFGDVFGVVAFGDNQESDVYTKREFLYDLQERRKSRKIGRDPIWYLERYGANIIKPVAFEPNPDTYRGDFYYNSKENSLYRKAISINKTYVWKKMR